MFSRIFFLFCFFYLPLSFANFYKRGDAACNDFQDAEKKYALKPSGGYAAAYGLCLLAKGVDDVRAINILELEASSRNRVDAAQILALYTATGGTMRYDELEESNYNEAFQAYGRVIFLISLHPDYPEKFMISEFAEQHELEAYFYLTWIPYRKYLAGAQGTDNAYLLQSPTYQGDRDLKLYPKYSPYTLDSLEQTIENAEICANLPRKAHFQERLYRQTVKYCKMMKRVAQGLLVLERERLTLLNDPACVRDIELCSEYQEVVLNEILPLIERKNQESNQIWSEQQVAIR